MEPALCNYSEGRIRAHCECHAFLQVPYQYMNRALKRKVIMKSGKQSIILIFMLGVCLQSVFARANNEANAEASDRANAKKIEREKTLLIYASDSFTSEWGLGPQIQDIFFERTGYTITFITYKDTLSTYNALEQMSGAMNYPDVFIGIDNNTASMALESGLFAEWAMTDDIQNHIPKQLFFDNNKTLVPFDYGYISVVYDSRKIAIPPKSLEDLTDSRFKNSIVLISPRGSHTGLAFFLWTVAVYGDGYTDYWNRLKPSILSVTDGWSAAYGLFVAGEAPLVISYTTSPAYHIAYENTDYIKATTFEKGNYILVEYAAITKNAQNKKGAEAFMSFLFSPEVQEKIALTNIMYPSRDDIPLPVSFDTLPKVKTSIDIYKQNDTVNTKILLNEWGEIMSSKANR